MESPAIPEKGPLPSRDSVGWRMTLHDHWRPEDTEPLVDAVHAVLDEGRAATPVSSAQPATQ
jgi:hypothetical protein